MSKRQALFTSCFLPAVGLVLVAAIIAGISLLTIPQQAREAFGPPASNLNQGQIYLLSAQLLLQKKALIEPANPTALPVVFVVESGESTSSLINRLAEAGLISQPGAFRNYLVYTGLDTGLQSGEHTLSAAMSAVEIAAALQSYTPRDTNFVVLAGWRIEEIAAALSVNGLTGEPQDFISAASQHPASWVLSSELPAEAGSEGFLFPGNYEISRDTQPAELVAILLQRFANEITPDLRAGFSTQGLNLYEAVTLASIVEREAIIDDEMPMIASVYLNRLAIGMKLDADPTVQYAVGYNTSQQTWWTNPLRARDLEIESLYNTYRYAGMPPGPIANPGLAALQAVAAPAESPYYYFRARCDGSGLHNFAITYQEHLLNACP